MRIAKGGVVHAVRGRIEDIEAEVERCKSVEGPFKGYMHGPTKFACSNASLYRKGEWVKEEIRETNRYRSGYWQRFPVSYIEILPPSTPITCKACLARMGDEDHVRKFTHRWVIQDPDGFFLKKSGWSRGGRTLEVADAKLYKTKGAANGINKYRVYLDGSGNEVSSEEWRRVPYKDRREMGWRIGERMGSKYRIRKVEVRLVDDDES